MVFKGPGHFHLSFLLRCSIHIWVFLTDWICVLSLKYQIARKIHYHGFVQSQNGCISEQVTLGTLTAESSMFLSPRMWKSPTCMLVRRVSMEDNPSEVEKEMGILEVVVVHAQFRESLSRLSLAVGGSWGSHLCVIRQKYRQVTLVCFIRPQ